VWGSMAKSLIPLLNASDVQYELWRVFCIMKEYDTLILMPVRHGSGVPRTVLDRFLYQSGTNAILFAPWIDSSDFSVTVDPHVARCATKRESLNMHAQDIPSRFVWFADDNVQLPLCDIFGFYDGVMAQHPGIGAIAGIYDSTGHVGAGALMLSRTVFDDLQPLSSDIDGGCECTAYRIQIINQGYRVLADHSEDFTHVDISLAESEFDIEIDPFLDLNEYRHWSQTSFSDRQFNLKFSKCTAPSRLKKSTKQESVLV